MSDDLLHGGALDRVRRRFPHAPQPWLDLSTGINPWAWPYPEALPSISEDAIHHLPTAAAYDACRAAMARAFGAPEESLVLAPGTELLIRLLPTVLQPRCVAVLAPSYGDHRATWSAAGCEVLATDDPLTLAEEAEVDMVVVCAPNNPDGRRFDLDALRNAHAALAERGGWLIVDEAYADLVPGQSLAPDGGAEGLVVLRSTGKFYGVAGLRLGAALAPPALRAALAARLGVWSVSGPALELGTRLYQDFAWQNATRLRLEAARRRVDGIFEMVGLAAAGGTDLFRFLAVDDASALFEALASRGVYVRRFAWSRDHLRMGLPADPAGEDRLAEALAACRGG
ncbi:MAG: threonine-phosphate decarboxylase CobD [Pseudomonadota bacterium]